MTEKSKFLKGVIDDVNDMKYTKDKAIPLYNNGKISEYFTEFGFEEPISAFNEEEQEVLNEKYFGYLLEATEFLKKAEKK